MKIAAILASLAIATTGAAAQVEETAFSLGHYIKHNVIGISEEEAYKLGHYIAHNVVGISEEEENMSLAEMAKRYNKVKKFIPVAEQEDLKLPKIGITIGEEEAIKNPKMIGGWVPEFLARGFGNVQQMNEFDNAQNNLAIEEEQNMSLIEMAKRYNKIKKFIPLAEEEALIGGWVPEFLRRGFGNVQQMNEFDNAQEEAMSLAEMAKRYNKIKKFIPVAEEEEDLKLPKIGITIGEEEAFNLKDYLKKKVSTVSQKASNLKNYIKSKVSGASEEEEQNLNLKNYIKHNVIGISEEEENMSLAEMAKRYNKIKKFIPAAEEEAINWKKLWANGPFEEEEENMSLGEMAKRYNKIKKFIPVAEEEEVAKVLCIVAPCPGDGSSHNHF